MATLLDLAKRMDRLAKAIAPEVNDLKKLVALTVITKLIHDTPVDTSKALSNWRVSMGGISDEIAAHYEGQHGSSQRSSAFEAIRQAKALIDAGKPGKALVIFNSVPYIRRLNEGYSAQAPAGFVEAAVLVGRRQVREAKFNLERRR